MKKTRAQRWLSLLLTLALCLTLAPAVLAADDYVMITKPEESSLTLKKGDKVNLEAEASGLYAWRSSDKDVASVDNATRALTAHKPGEAYIYAFLRSNTAIESTPLHVVVSGVAVPDTYTIRANQPPIDLLDVAIKNKWCKGDVDEYSLKFTSGNTGVVKIDDGFITGLQVGMATVRVEYGFMSDTRKETETFTVEVEKDPKTVIPSKENVVPKAKDGAVPVEGNRLDFKTLPFPSRLGGSAADNEVIYITALFVPTDKGTLYYDYQSEAMPGSGVGQNESYYLKKEAGQRIVGDVTFVPKPSYPGGKVTITFNAVTKDLQNYPCEINLTVEGTSGNDSPATTGISLQTGYGEAVHFDSIEFGSVCREKLGVQLDYVIFSQPPERQGTLYTNYVSSGNYGSVVDVHKQYSRRNLDDVWFVPGPGQTGPVTVYYTGYGTNGESYSGLVIIQVGQMDETSGGGLLSYRTSPGGVVRFDDDDFDDYFLAVLDPNDIAGLDPDVAADVHLSGIRFESLPSESQGILYYDYRTSANPGARVVAGTVYYPDTRAPRIDRLFFVVATDFTGTIKLPFTGWSSYGSSFSGTVEINVSGAVTSGDIYYYCAPGDRVYFERDDFIRRSREITNRTLDYIRLTGLPDSAEGDLYYNSARVNTTGTRYTSSNISRLSFRASRNFSGMVTIPFEGVSTGGDSFTGVIAIGSGGGSTGTGNTNTGSGSGGGTVTSSTIRYITDSQTAAVFDRDDFDDLSQWEYSRDISSVRFDRADLPSSSQGSLYQNYRSSSNMGTKITSGTTITASNLDRLAFVPASGYTGTVYIDFTGTATGSSGNTFYGTLEIDVGTPAANVMAQYSTRTAPVHFYPADLAQSGSSLSSIRFTSLPSSGAGYLYYQYTSPTQYGTQVNTGTTYNVSGSNLISDLAFVPRAGYTGTVTIPYTGTNSNNATFTGEVVIAVSPTNISYYFNDMAGYSGAQISAVDFLYDHNVTRGLGDGRYGPENPIRRGDFALMLYQAFEFFPVSYGTTFTDVSPDAYYATAVNTLYARGVVSGTGGGRYAPDGTLTRQDAVCMIQRAMQTIGWNASDGYSSALAGYSDSSSVSGYAQGAMALAVQRGYLPTSGGRLNPQQPLTRVDMAELLHRALTY